MNFKNIVNITDIITEQSKLQPHAIAIKTEDNNITYLEFENLIWKTATYLNKNSIKKGDIVAITISDQLTLLVTILSLARIGATAFTLSETLSEEIKKNKLEEASVNKYINDFESKNNLYQITNINFNNNLLLNLPDEADYTIRSTDCTLPYFIVTGSGSTGKSKLMPITHKTEINKVKLSLSFLPKSKDNCFTSLPHLYFYSTLMNFQRSLCAGYSIALLKSFNPFTDCEKYNITILYSTVFHAHSMLNLIPPSSKNLLNNLKMLYITGSYVSEDLKKRISTQLTKQLYIIYGSNEANAATIFTPQDMKYNIKNSVGKIVKGVEVEIVNEKDEILPLNTIGLIRVKSPASIQGYINDDIATRKFFKNGWFYPQDIGKITSNGQVIYLGRNDDKMIFNGINIYPIEIENTLSSHPLVIDSFATSIKHPVHQDIPVSLVQIKENSKVTEPILLEFCQNKLGSHSPQLIFFIEKIPRNKQGKIIKKDVLDFITRKLNKNIAPSKNNKYKQPMQEITISLPKDSNTNLDNIDNWLSNIFQINLETCYFLENNKLNKKHQYIAKLAWRILLLRKALLQATYVPIFDTGSIIEIIEDDSNYKVVVLIARIDNILPEIYIKTINLTINLLLNELQEEKNEKKRDIVFKKIITTLINPFRPLTGSGISTIPILKEAYKKNIPFLNIGNGIYKLGWGSRAKLIQRSSTISDSALGVILSDDKMLASSLLRNAGLPSPKHAIATSYEEALNIAQNLKWPIVTKPIDQNRGEGVSINIDNSQKLQTAFDIAYTSSNQKKVIVEKQVPGICCRIFIANGTMLYGVKRLPKSIIGDGIKTVQQLIQDANNKNTSLPPWKMTEYFPIDKEAVKAIENAGFTLNTIAKKGQLVPLRDIESTQWGGYDEDISNIIHPANIDIAIRATKLFGLYIAGIDIISSDISVPWYKNGAIINEVNFAPTYGGGEISKATIPTFLKNLIKDDGRIPITVIIGNDDAMKKAKTLQKEKIKNQINCYITSHKNSFTPRKNEIIYPFNTTYDRVKALLLDNNVDELIIVIQTNDILQTGLPVDNINEIIEISEVLISSENKKNINSNEYKRIVDLCNSLI